MNPKKYIPLDILKQFEKYSHLNGIKFKIEIDSKKFKFVDIDDNSEFYFEILGKDDKNSTEHKIELNPPRTDSTKSTTVNIKTTNIGRRFGQWLNMVEEYDKTRSFWDDPIIKSNAERFYQKYKINDDNANIETFDLDQQLFLEEYLNRSKNNLKKLKQKLPKEKVIEVEILEGETDEIKSALTTESKNKIMMRLSKFWGRAQKTGLVVIKEVFVNIITEVAKRLFLGS